MLARFEWFDGLAPHQCFIETGIIRLPTLMAGRLQPEEWRPLIASTLIYTYDHTVTSSKSGLYRRNAVKAVGIFLVGLILVLAISILFPYSPERDLVRSMIIGAMLPALLLSVRKSGSNLGDSLLTADCKAADLVGRDNFLEVLRKIGKLQPYSYSTDSETSAPFYPNPMVQFPTLAERIENLSRAASG